jgi:sugar lactone lactonase YvrE
METDGTNFYLVDFSSKRLYRFQFGTSALIPDASFPLTLKPEALVNPRGLAFDGTYLWLADQATGLIHKISPTDGSSLGAIDAYDGFSGSTNVGPTGVAFIDGDMWVADRDPTTKMLYNLSSFMRKKTQFFYANKGNEYFHTPETKPTGLTFDGTDFWLADDSVNTLYRLDRS